MLEVVAAKILESAAESAVGILADQVRRRNEELRAKGTARLRPPLQVSHLATNSRLQQHLSDVRHWSGSTSFADMRGKKSLAEVYLELDTFVMPVRTHVDPTERLTARPILKALSDSDGHCIILGQPGAGKTTSVQKLCLDYFKRGKLLLNYNFPLVIRLREVRGTERIGPIFLALASTLGMPILMDEARWDTVPAEWFGACVEPAILAFVEALGAGIVLDGFDEIPDPEDKARALGEIRRLARGLSSSRLFVTSRSGDFTVHVEGASKFEISPLSTAQIADFSQRWLGDSSTAKLFLGQVLSSPFADTAMRPLTLAHLCAIFERVGSIPEKPKSVYRKVVNLLLEEWDAQRSVRRHSLYAKFDADRKFEFLAQLAFVLTSEYRASVFSSDALASAYTQICKNYALPIEQAPDVALELESHTGLLVESGYRSYEFAHKSIQEYS